MATTPNLPLQNGSALVGGGHGSSARFKESERIRVGGWPKPAAFRQWRMNLIDEVVAASAKPQKAFDWVIEVTHLTATYDTLEIPETASQPWMLSWRRR